ncbi:DNA primase [Streptomyces minutiscleroticus]|uniref:DNA primase n=1 Tax=Streptomyces minutiscleroticus TaxID=68238 RepID=A0A918KQ06_9ACTN|nr:DNA primase [Streptomyces minutiscleroticus]GGX72211.1 hypothetical protein GCM10010358_28240 [Streptomyces minutiscleroticus]
MNRLGLGLAVGAGYVLGRTKKMKLAFAVGTMVAGKKLQLSPRAIGDLISTQLQNNPQFKELGDQLRTDLRGVGRAATGALVERQVEALAGRLHGRTAEVRDRIAGVVPDVPGPRRGGRGRDEEPEDAYDDDRDDRDDEAGYHDDGPDAEPEEERERPPAKRAPAKKTARAAKAPARKAADGAPRAAKKAAKKAPAKKTAAAGRARRRARGGDDG